VTWRRLAIGLALFPAWLAVVFVVSLFYGGEEYPPLSGGIVVAVLMVAVTWLLASKVAVPNPKAAAALGSCWLFGFVALQLFITIPNGTVDVIFGSATTYLTYAGIVAGLVLAARRRVMNLP
jgi:phosphatidylserine synthase